MRLPAHRSVSRPPMRGAEWVHLVEPERGQCGDHKDHEEDNDDRKNFSHTTSITFRGEHQTPCDPCADELKIIV